jgi:hypothetical protein
MATTNQLGRSPEELTRLGVDLLKHRIEPAVKTEDAGKFVAIDVDAGDFEIHTDDYAAVAALLVRRPQADIWLGRIGEPSTYRVGKTSDKRQG